MERPGNGEGSPEGAPSPGGGAPSTDEAPATPFMPSRRSYRWEDWVGAAVMGLLTLITFANVLVRYFTSQSFAWTEEISVSLMVVLTLVAASVAVVRDRHIRVEVLFYGGSKARRRWLGLLSALATIVAFAILAALGGKLAWDDYQYEVTSPGIGIPQWWYTATMPALCVVVAWRAIAHFVTVWKDR
jgi:TRAP-type C4-dicarboxylate transport system permease small subunit